MTPDIAFSNGRKDYLYYGLGYRVELLTMPTLDYENQVTKVEMYIFNNRIVDLNR